MQTPTQRGTKRTNPAAPAPLPYPDTNAVPEQLFWLGAYFRDLTESVALDALIQEMHRRHRPLPLLHALSGARIHQKSDVKLSLGYVVQLGLLPFAHPNTTIFNAPGAVQ